MNIDEAFEKYCKDVDWTLPWNVGVKEHIREGFIAGAESQGEVIKAEQQRTLYYKELLYSQTKQGELIKSLKEDLKWALGMADSSYPDIFLRVKQIITKHGLDV